MLQFLPEYDINIMVIANSCSDDTRECLQEYQRQQHSKQLLPIEFTEEPKAGKSYALNKALTFIPDGWVYFITDLVLRALEGNEKLRYIPDIVQYHYVGPLIIQSRHQI